MRIFNNSHSRSRMSIAPQQLFLLLLLSAASISIYAQDAQFYNFYLDGNGYLVTKKFDKAIDNYNKALARFPIDYVYFNRGNARFGMKDYTGAIADYDKTLSLNNEYATAYYQRALVKIEQGKVPEGCDDLKLAKKYNSPGANDAFKKHCK